MKNPTPQRCCILAFLAACAAGAPAQEPQRIDTTLQVHDASPALAVLALEAAAPQAGASRKAVPLRMVPPQTGARRAPHEVRAGRLPFSPVPSGPASPALPQVNTGATTLNVDGMSAHAGLASGVNGAVGATDYVQLAGSRLALYRKSDGALLLGPVNGNAVFGGFAGSAGAQACALTNDGASGVHYDKLAQRWIMTQLAWAPGTAETGPFYQCIAVSGSSDVLGSYHRYVLELRSATNKVVFADDPKLGVWPDAYYLTLVLYDTAAGGYRGPRVCGLGRAAMLAGENTTVRCRDLGSQFGALLPSDLDGGTAPPEGSPNFLLSMDFSGTGKGDHLLLWRFSFSGNMLSGPIQVPVAPFTIACPGSQGGACIRQAAPGETLHAMGDRLMHRLAYRNFGTHEAMVVNHTVQQSGARQDGPSALRWYEIRDPNGAVALYQQGTHAPDADSRWMGSIAMDKMGNIALGYNVAGAASAPGMRYTGRLRSDAPGRMQAEAVVVNGSGVQVDSFHRWGGQGALAADPGNDCTFWSTRQYVPTTGRFTARSRIASFTFLNCRQD